MENTDKKKEISSEEMENKVKELKDQYNDQLRKVLDIQKNVSDRESDCHRLLRKIWKVSKEDGDISEMETQYNTQYSEMEELQIDCFKQQTECYHLLQSLYQNENFLLVSYIQALREQNTKQAEKIKSLQGETEQKTGDKRINNLE